MTRSWDIQYYEDLNFIKKLFYKHRLSKQLKKRCKQIEKQCKFTVMMDSPLDCRSETGFNDLLERFF